MKKIISAQILLLIIGITVFAQADWKRYEEEAKQRKIASEQREADLQQILKQSGAAKILKANIEAGKKNAVSNAVSTDDNSLIPYLKWLVAGVDSVTDDSSEEFQAQIALIKLGDEQTFDKVAAELISNDYFVQDFAVRKLARAGTKASFRKLSELLDDVAERDVSSLPSDARIAFANKSETAMYELSLVVENPPIKKGSTGGTVQLWKDWFKLHKNLIE